MKKIALAYRGIFYYQKYSKEGLTKNLLDDLEKNLDNHKSLLYTCFGECEIEFFFSTYDLEKEIKDLYEKNLDFKYYGNVPQISGDGAGWKLHLIHHKKLITEIKSHMERSRTPYDFLVFTRPDIKLLKSIDSFNIQQVDFIKIDVESYEYEVLKGAENTIKTNKPILGIEILKKYQPNHTEIVQYVKSLGYEKIAKLTHDVIFKPV